MRARRQHPRLFGVLWTLFVLLVLGLGFTAAYFLSAALFQVLHLSLPALWLQLLNSFLGLTLTGLLIGAFSRFFRRQQLNAFQPILQAMERIARGDFSIRLEDEQEDGILSGLVRSVNRMAQNLGQVESMRQEFIANVSHEIQSPLTSIRGFAQALRSATLAPADRQHYLEIIEAESRRLSRLTEDLLKLAALDAEQAQIVPLAYPLDQQVRSVILTCEPQWRDKGIELEVDLQVCEIRADADLLSQVWMNLLHNAIKFTPTGGKIRIALQPRGAEVEFTIADSGIGISAEERVHIFERFYKADPSRTRAAGGSGLGLAIAKKIIDLHHGRIELTSGLGQGTTFRIHLPKETAWHH